MNHTTDKNAEPKQQKTVCRNFGHTRMNVTIQSVRHKVLRIAEGETSAP